MAKLPDNFIPQAKMLRVFELINALALGQSSIEDLAKVISTNARTVYRYFKLLEEIGFQINKHYGQPARYSLGTDYYPVFVSHFREDVWKIKNRISENPKQLNARLLQEQERRMSHA